MGQIALQMDKGNEFISYRYTVGNQAAPIIPLPNWDNTHLYFCLVSHLICQKGSVLCTWEVDRHPAIFLTLIGLKCLRHTHIKRYFSISRKVVTFESSSLKWKVQIFFTLKNRETHFFAKVLNTIASNIYYSKWHSSPACQEFPEGVEWMLQ